VARQCELPFVVTKADWQADLQILSALKHKAGWSERATVRAPVLLSADRPRLKAVAGLVPLRLATAVRPSGECRTIAHLRGTSYIFAWNGRAQYELFVATRE